MKRLLYILLFAIASLPIYADARLDSLFVEAVYSHDFDLMSQYAEQGANIDIRHRGYDHLMHYYAAKDDIDGVRWCINHHMDVNQLDSLGATPLIHATCDGYSTICKLLIDNGANTQIKSSYGMAASEYAAHNSFPALSAYIINPTTVVPHDFYNYRKEIAKALRFADCKKAKKIANEALKFAKKELSPKNRYNVYLLIDLASIYELDEDYASQIKCLNEACLYAEKNIPRSEIYFRAKTALVIAKFSQGDTEGVLDSLLYYQSYSDKFLDNETLWLLYTGIATCGAKEGFVRNGETILYQALDYAISLMHDDYDYYVDYVINTYGNILDLAVQIGDVQALKEAEMCYSRIKAGIAGRYDYIASMNRARLGHYCRFIGQPDFAIMWYQKSNEEFAKTIGKKHIFYGQNLFNIGNIEFQKGRLDSAIVYFSQSKEILKRKGKLDSYMGGLIDQSIATNLLLLYVMNPQRYALNTNIENLFKSALEKLNKYTPSPDLNVAATYENLALYYLFSEDYKQALDYSYKAMALTESLVGKSNQSYLSNIISALISETYTHNAEKVGTLISDYVNVSSNLIKDQFLILPESDRSDMWNNIYGNIYRSLLPSIIHVNIEKRPILSKDLYNCALFSKGLLLHTSGEIQSRLRDMHDTEIDQFLDAITSNKKRLMEIEQAYPGEYPDEWGQLMLELDDMEKIALNLGRKFQDNLFLDKVSWNDIKEHLLPKQTAIEILRFDADGLVDKSDSTYYIATIVTRDTEKPQYVYLFEESELIPLVISSNKDNIYNYDRNGRQLSEMIWCKLLPYIGDAKTIYFSPDGILCQLAVEALPLSADSVYGDAYNIVRCSSTKFILQQRKEDQPTSVDLFGGIQYDMTPKEMTNKSNALAMRDAYRGEMPDSLTRGHYEELIGAKQEVSNIAQLLNNSHIEGRLYIGSDASEEAFKALSGSHPNVLHIATHGFFWPQEEAERKDYFMASFMANDKASRYVSSMERAGLLFAGANVAMTGHRDELPSNVEDGVLSAQEISTMDLYGTDLVVLSACETGQGDLESDGVYGLQRAFKLAGVQTIIMSLWKVNDAATQMLMTEFYSNWIVNKMNKRKAFEAAKQKVRSTYPEPSCWAGFIMLD